MRNDIMITILAILVFLFFLYIKLKAAQSGKSPAEYLFGGKKAVKPAPKKEAPREAAKPEGNGKPEKGSDQHDVDTVIKWLASFSRRNKCMLLVPGGLKIGDETGRLTAVLIRRTRVIGFMFFGYGGISSVYHVGIYIGDGRLLHAANSSEGIIISDLASFAQYNSITTIQRYI